MPLPFAKYCAYWFVKTSLGPANDTDPPEDEPLRIENRARLAHHIVVAVNHAALATPTHRVNLDPESFVSTAGSWRTLFDTVDCMMTCARQSGARGPTLAAPASAFADYMATRWIYRRVLREEVAARPPDDEEFPPPYDADAKRGLAEALVANARHIGLSVKNKNAFVMSASRWKSLSDPRSALLKRVTLLFLMMAIEVPRAEAQLVDAGGTADEILSVFFQKANDDGWRGGIATRGEQTAGAPSVRINWQLDYGSLGSERVTPSGTATSRESDVSKNSGVYTISYVRNHSDRWRVKADAGIEHRRALNADQAREDRATVIVNGSLRYIGAQSLRRGGLEPQASWLLQGNIATSSALAPEGEARALFFDPVVAAWFSFLPGYVSKPDQPRLLFRRIQFRAELAAMGPFDRDLDAKAHWDGSVVFFFTPGNGMMLRRFSGFFDHNLRDRKAATTVSLLWKFR